MCAIVVWYGKFTSKSSSYACIVKHVFVWHSMLPCRVKSQLKRLARPMYSNPPIHGARIVANIVGDPTMFGEWKQEMEQMAGRIKNVRQKLYDSLSAKDKSGKDWSFILRQIGMFSYTGLNKAQVKLFLLLHMAQAIQLPIAH